MAGTKKPPSPRSKARTALSVNVGFLMESALQEGRTIDGQMERPRITSRVSPKTLHNLRKDQSIDPRLSTIEAVAAAFGLEAWQLLMPDLTADLILSPPLMRLIKDYLDTPETQRAAIENVAQATAQLKKARPK